MRDENGVFLGNDGCANWDGVDRIEERFCCGGRKKHKAFVRCRKRGVVEAEITCKSACSDKVEKQKGNMR